MSNETNLRAEDVTPDTDPHDIVEAVIADDEAGDIEAADELLLAAAVNGVPAPSDEDAERLDAEVAKVDGDEDGDEADELESLGDLLGFDGDEAL